MIWNSVRMKTLDGTAMSFRWQINHIRARAPSGAGHPIIFIVLTCKGYSYPKAIYNYIKNNPLNRMALFIHHRSIRTSHSLVFFCLFCFFLVVGRAGFSLVDFSAVVSASMGH